MNITVESKDFSTVLMLRDGPIPEGISVQVTPVLQHNEISITGLRSPIAVISAAADVPIGLLADWLYDKIKGKPARLTINHTPVDIVKHEITKVLQEEMKEE